MHKYAKVLITDKTGRTLCLFRSANHPEHPQHPDLPGGEIEEYETAAEAVAREVKEETGLTIVLSKLTQVFSRQTEIPQLNIVFRYDLDEQDPPIVLSWEHERHKWVTDDWLLNVEIKGKIDDYFLTLKDYLRNKTT